MRPLTESDVKGIHDLYPASEIESIEVFEKLAGSLPGETSALDPFSRLQIVFCSAGYGIFTVDGELAAWMVQSYYGAMFSMQTKPEHRRKG
jgi:FR47-like protein